MENEQNIEGNQDEPIVEAKAETKSLDELSNEELKSKAETLAKEVKDLKASTKDKDIVTEEKKKEDNIKWIQKSERELKELQEKSKEDEVKKATDDKITITDKHLGKDEFEVDKNKAFLRGRDWNYESEEFKILEKYLKMGSISDFKSGSDSKTGHAGVLQELEALRKENESYEFIKEDGVKIRQDNIDSLVKTFKEKGLLPKDERLKEEVLDAVNS